jgi:hypothetical protein
VIETQLPRQLLRMQAGSNALDPTAAALRLEALPEAAVLAVCDVQPHDSLYARPAAAIGLTRLLDALRDVNKGNIQPSLADAVTQASAAMTGALPDVQRANAFVSVAIALVFEQRLYVARLGDAHWIAVESDGEVRGSTGRTTAVTSGDYGVRPGSRVILLNQATLKHTISSEQIAAQSQTTPGNVSLILPLIERTQYAVHHVAIAEVVLDTTGGFRRAIPRTAAVAGNAAQGRGLPKTDATLSALGLIGVTGAIMLGLIALLWISGPGTPQGSVFADIRTPASATSIGGTAVTEIPLPPTATPVAAEREAPTQPPAPPPTVLPTATVIVPPTPQPTATNVSATPTRRPITRPTRTVAPQPTTPPPTAIPAATATAAPVAPPAEPQPPAPQPPAPQPEPPAPQPAPPIPPALP